MSKPGFTPYQVRRKEICGTCLIKTEIVGIYYGSAICNKCLDNYEEDGTEKETSLSCK